MVDKSQKRTVPSKSVRTLAPIAQKNAQLLKQASYRNFCYDRRSRNVDVHDLPAGRIYLRLCRGWHIRELDQLSQLHSSANWALMALLEQHVCVGRTAWLLTKHCSVATDRRAQCEQPCGEAHPP